jgi:hypothetical protein
VMTRPLPANSILPNKSQPFSIVWADNTDSICDLQCFLTYVDNYVNKRHKKADATRPSTTNGSVCNVSNGTVTPSSLPSSSSLPESPPPPHNLPPASPVSAVGIFTGIPSIPGDLVDSLTRSGSFVFLSELFDTECLFEFRGFRIARVMPKGEVVQQFAANTHLVLDLPDKYPVRQIISSASRFQRGDWKGLWETTLFLARKDIDTNNKRKHNHGKRDTSSIRDRVVYTEHCARKGSLSKTNQVITSKSMPNADPINIDLLRAKHPETAHPDRDPVRLTSRLWPTP